MRKRAAPHTYPVLGGYTADGGGPRQDTPQRLIPDGSEPDPTAAGRRRNKKNTQRRTAAERTLRKTAAGGAMRDRVDEMMIGRTELKVEGSSESEVNVDDTTHECQKARARPPHGGQAVAEELARAILVNICAAKLGPCRSACLPHQNEWSVARRQRLGA